MYSHVKSIDISAYFRYNISKMRIRKERNMNQIKKQFYIYRYVYRGEIIYLGKTNRNLYYRIQEHQNEVKFMPYLSDVKIQYYELKTQVEMDIAEKYWINVYSPRLNVVDMDGATFNFTLPEPCWKPYNDMTFRQMITDVAHIAKMNMPNLLQSRLNELESEYTKYESALALLEYWFELYTTVGLDIRGSYVYYDWDMDSNPLPDNVAYNHNVYSFFVSSTKKLHTYENKISWSVCEDLMFHGKDALKQKQIALRGEIIELETEMERKR